MQYDDAQRDPRLFPYALQVLLVLAFLTGGSSIVSGWDDAAVQLLAVPVLAWGLWRLPNLASSRWRTVTLTVAAAIAAVPLMQLLPLPASLWTMPEARQLLADDLAAVGANPPLTWSFAPAATERAFLFLLPPLALFVGALTVGHETHRRLLRSVMLLALLSLVLAFLQLGVPAESVLNPFPQWAAQFNGVFANQNHQAISLVVGIVVALTGVFATLPRRHESLRQRWAPWVLGFIALCALLSLPLTQSRGAMIIGLFAVASVPLALGMWGGMRKSVGVHLGLVGCLILVGVGVWSIAVWMQGGAMSELRDPIRDAAIVFARHHMPLGVGVGSFVAAFEQSSPSSLLLGSYINHAHNEYVQWWVEAGWLGLAVPVAAVASLVLLGRIAYVSKPATHQPEVVASLVGLGALVAHGSVDYPLRTGTLSSVAAVLAAIVVAAACEQKRRGAEGDK